MIINYHISPIYGSEIKNEHATSLIHLLFTSNEESLDPFELEVGKSQNQRQSK
jgi:hypothetical protein